MSTTPQPHPSVLSQTAVDAMLVDTTPWLSCDDCFDQLDTYVEARLRDRDHPDRDHPDRDHHDEAMDKHLQGCAACAEEARSLLDLLTPTDG